ncbi:MAG: hypothetical protein JNM34_06315 [Chthonomonadaceae bacterium]|nr:hypothetical protein [Chthonomonadaceae bacterium]
MLAVYLFGAILGGGLIVFSALAGMSSHAEVGGHGLDHSTDNGAGHGSDHGTGAAWLPFLSLRFWIYAVGAFGLTGAGLTFFKASQEPATLVIATVAGLLMGFSAATIVRLLSRAESTSGLLENDFLGAIAKVSVQIGTLPGKVRTSIKGEIIDLVASCKDGESFSIGDEVMIVDVEGNSVTVARQADFLGE